MIRLIATDLDGTLLAPDGSIPALNVAAVRRATDAGVVVVIATGRPLRWLGVLEGLASAHPLVIVSNGAALYDLRNSRVLTTRGMAADDVCGIVGDLRQVIPDATFAVERGDVFGCEPGSLSLHADDPETVVAPIDELVVRIRPIVKLLVHHRGLSSDELHVAASPVVGGRATVTHSLTHSDFGMLELSAPGVTKARMLGELAAGLGIDPADAIAFGDMPNDLDMLTWAGTGYVMADAHPVLRERFEVIGSNADAGVGRAILDLLGG